ncbi:MAG: formylglycine-generating enzyme family protein [Planctomycetes bacterium]|nr:formylglycine-generating enzyme family protein [Planctomycetota bacterium]
MKYIRKKYITILVLILLMAAITLAKHARSQPQNIAVADKGDMVLIDGGSFQMGNENGSLDEKPIHQVSVNSFMMDIYEVTYQQYREFIEDNPQWRKGNVEIDLADLSYLHDWENLSYPQEKDNHPIVYISWHAAKTYAEWAGKTLPTEAQWEYASRGGYRNMDYPWGNEFKSSLTQWRGSKETGTTQVGRYTINGFGLHDMLGNAGEWTGDGYELYQAKEVTDPSSPLNRHLKVLRGGSWKSKQADLRVSARRAYRPNMCLPDAGFRCVLTKY